MTDTVLWRYLPYRHRRIHCESVLLSITLANINRFHFFHCWIRH